MKARSLLPSWDCAKCTSSMMKVRGCHTEGANVTLLGEEKVTRCPLRFIRDDRDGFNWLMRHYRFMEQGHLPEAGGMGDQPAAFVDAMAYIGMAAQEVSAAMRSKGGAPGAPRRGR